MRQHREAPTDIAPRHSAEGSAERYVQGDEYLVRE